MTVRDASTLLETAVRATLDALTLTDADEAAKQLAIRYARIIDRSDDPKLEAWAMRWIAPLLLDCLGELGATPAARTRLKTGKPDDAKPSKLTALRSQHPA